MFDVQIIQADPAAIMKLVFIVIYSFEIRLWWERDYVKVHTFTMFLP